MTRWSAPDLARATGGMLREPFHATGVSIDSRTTRPGDLFVALATATGDGHAHVAAALGRGAAGAMVHELPPGLPDDAPLLQVADTFAGLQALGVAARARFQGRVIAVTGSVGKTTTKEMLRAALAPYGRVWAAEASHNNHWGVPLTLARCPPAHDFCVVEIGMNHAGEVAPLSRMAQPDVAVVTTVTAAHIGNLGSLEAIAAEKFSIRDGLSPGGAFISPDRARPDAVEPDADGSTVSAGRLSFRVGAPGPHMVDNAMTVLAVLDALGLDPEVGLRALASFTPVVGRGARRTVMAGAAVLLDESYNASSSGVRAALAVLALQTASRKLAVLGDMLELGAFSESEHVGLAVDAARAADLVFACGPAMRAMFEALPPDRQGAHAPDSRELAPIVVQAVRPGDAVLVKGSLGSRMKIVVDALAAA